MKDYVLTTFNIWKNPASGQDLLLMLTSQTASRTMATNQVKTGPEQRNINSDEVGDRAESREIIENQHNDEDKKRNIFTEPQS